MACTTSQVLIWRNIPPIAFRVHCSLRKTHEHAKRPLSHDLNLAIPKTRPRSALSLTETIEQPDPLCHHVISNSQVKQKARMIFTYPPATTRMLRPSSLPSENTTISCTRNRRASFLIPGSQHTSCEQQKELVRAISGYFGDEGRVVFDNVASTAGFGDDSQIF